MNRKQIATALMAASSKIKHHAKAAGGQNVTLAVFAIGAYQEKGEVGFMVSTPVLTRAQAQAIMASLDTIIESEDERASTPAAKVGIA